MLKLWLTIMKAMVLVAAFSSLSHAQEVYNFYFQKDQGPDTVVQGAGLYHGPPKPSWLDEEFDETFVAPKAATTKSSKKRLEAQVSTKPKKWSLNIGYGRLSSSYFNSYDIDGTVTSCPECVIRTEGLSLGLAYDFNRYIRVEGYLLAGGKAVEVVEGGGGRVEYSLGGAISPFRWTIFGKSYAEASLLLGAATVDQPELLGGEQWGYWYYGVGILVNFSKRWALQWRSLINVKDQYSYDFGEFTRMTQSTAGLVYRF